MAHWTRKWSLGRDRERWNVFFTCCCAIVVISWIIISSQLECTFKEIQLCKSFGWALICHSKNDCEHRQIYEIEKLSRVFEVKWCSIGPAILWPTQNDKGSIVTIRCIDVISISLIGISRKFINAKVLSWYVPNYLTNFWIDSSTSRMQLVLLKQLLKSMRCDKEHYISFFSPYCYALYVVSWVAFHSIMKTAKFHANDFRWPTHFKIYNPIVTSNSCTKCSTLNSIRAANPFNIISFTNYMTRPYR